MGIPKLNKLLLEKCQNSIKKIHLEMLIHKKIAVDISIYLYKFLTDGDYMEQLYLFLSVFKYYCIVPIFVFDGKPPVEKYALLKKRYLEKQHAQIEYNKMEELINEIDDPSKIAEIEQNMHSLKKKMTRVTYQHIDKSIELIKAFGFEHYFAPHEADQLCVYLTTSGITYATLSDDMDMVVSGCHLVLRNLSLLHHEVTLYDTNHILQELDLSLAEFRDIVVLSGTDYEFSTKQFNITIRKSFDYFKKYKELDTNIGFYEWLHDNGIDTTDMYKISSLLNIDNYKNELEEFIKKNKMEKPKFSVSIIKQIMRQYKFIFV